ncbi:MAG: hypothetical protein IH901_02895 [Proteobacteria bacterium]|nr:hypothetical protein [Pseudomonadota bacterium]
MLSNLDPLIDQNDPKKRFFGKVLNYSLVYGAGDGEIAYQMKTNRQEATKARIKFFEVYAGIRSYIDETGRQAEKDGCVRTMMGRRRSMIQFFSLSQKQ